MMMTKIHKHDDDIFNKIEMYAHKQATDINSLPTSLQIKCTRSKKQSKLIVYH